MYQSGKKLFNIYVINYSFFSISFFSFRRRANDTRRNLYRTNVLLSTAKTANDMPFVAQFTDSITFAWHPRTGHVCMNHI